MDSLVQWSIIAFKAFVWFAIFFGVLTAVYRDSKRNKSVTPRTLGRMRIASWSLGILSALILFTGIALFALGLNR